MTDATWKAHERRAARLLGGKRLGATGQSTPDVISGDGNVVAECKHRQALPQWITDALGKVRAQAGAHRLGVVVLHEHGARDSIVCLALKDWRARYGELPGTSGEDADGGQSGSTSDAE